MKSCTIMSSKKAFEEEIPLKAFLYAIFVGVIEFFP